MLSNKVQGFPNWKGKKDRFTLSLKTRKEIEMMRF